MKNAYYLCSKKVIDLIKPKEVSAPFKSGYSFDKEDDYFIAVLNFSETERIYYDTLSNEDRVDFWTKEICSGTMDVSTITLTGLRENGIFKEIELKTGLTTERNQAMVLNNLSERFNLTPIELIGKILKTN